MTEAELAARRQSHSAMGRRRSRRPTWLTGKVVVVVTVLGAVIAATAGALIALRPTTVIPIGCTVNSTTSNLQYTLSTEQAQNAAIIAAVAYRKGMPDHAVTVALAVSLQESGLRNLPYGDRDSVGLFQQRPSEGWGTTAQLLDPLYATSAFYDRLAQVPGWQALAVAEAGQAVQLSAAPDAYAAWDDEAHALAVALTGEVAAGFSCRFNGFGGAVPAPTALGQALANEMGTNLIGAAVTPKTGWQTASWAVAHAYSYHVRSVSFAGRTWEASSGAWTTDSGTGSPQVVTVQSG